MEEIENKNCYCKECNIELMPEKTRYLIIETTTAQFYCVLCLIKNEINENEEIINKIDEIIKDD